MHYKFFENIYELEKNSHLKLVPALTYAHIFPTVWLRMTVRLATQLFSKHVAMAIHFRRNDPKTSTLFGGRCMYDLAFSYINSERPL